MLSQSLSLNNLLEMLREGLSLSIGVGRSFLKKNWIRLPVINCTPKEDKQLPYSDETGQNIKLNSIGDFITCFYSRQIRE